jgi:Conserved TM helix
MVRKTNSGLLRVIGLLSQHVWATWPFVQLYVKNNNWGITMNETFFTGLLGNLKTNLGDLLPSILGALVVLAIGWVVALIASSLVRKLLGALNKRTGQLSTSTGLQDGLAKAIFWVIMLFAIFIALDKFHDAKVAGPLSGALSQTFAYLPKLVAGGVLALVGWLVASVVRLLSTKALAATSLDEKLMGTTDSESMSANIGNLLFSLVFLLFIPLILDALQMNGLLQPIQAMIQKMLGILPNIFGAGIIGAIGWLIAKILRNITTTVLNTAGVDNWGQRLGFQSDTSLAGMAGFIVFLFVFINALIGALNTLGIEAISRPATDMLQKVMAIIPNLFAAAAVLVIAYYVGRFVAASLNTLLHGLGFNNLPNKLGFTMAANAAQPSAFVGKAALFYVMLFATVEAANMVGFHQVRDVVTMFIQFGGQVLLGGVIFVVGFWLANMAHNAVVASGGNEGAAKLVRFTIIGLVTAMGLRAMGLADDIVNLAFGLTLGAVAVAVALSFGLGGREAAGKQMEYWLGNLRK